MSKKVVHVLGAMNVGGVEAWLMTLLRNIDSSQVQHEFIVHSKEKAFYDDEVFELGSNIYHCKHSENPFKYGLNLYRLLKLVKPDVVHSHVHTFSGIVLLISFMAGVKFRISHSHSDTRVKDKKASFVRRLYLSFMRVLISIFATQKLAVSQLAAECLYGVNWKNKKNCRVVMCGIDLEKYKSTYKDFNMRSNLGIPIDAYVLGHVGRFSEPKNHDFLINIFSELRKKNDKAYLVLVGDGELRGEIEEKVKRLGLKEYVSFLGLRKDVPIIMLSVFDVVVFPSLWEGLPLTLVEAQFANKKVIASSNITSLCDIGLIKFKDLRIADWVEEIEIDNFCSNKKYDTTKGVNFTIENNIKILNGIYEA